MTTSTKKEIKINGVVCDIDSCETAFGGHYTITVKGTRHVLTQSILSSWGNVNKINCNGNVYERVSA